MSFSELQIVFLFPIWSDLVHVELSKPNLSDDLCWESFASSGRIIIHGVIPFFLGDNRVLGLFQAFGQLDWTVGLDQLDWTVVQLLQRSHY
ncbi:hypothetical protein ACWPKS_07480 [Coraliomargarita sp. W4R72]